MLDKARQRIYDRAWAEAATDGWQVVLDGRPLPTPAGTALVLPTQGLAAAIAAEWDGQGETVEPATMPLMRLASTAIDRVAEQRAGVIATIAGYAETELICYRAREPADLVEQQAQHWDPLLAWLRSRYDAVLTPTTGLLPQPQPDSALQALHDAVASRNDFALAALAEATQAAGSLAVGLALVEGFLDVDGAFAAAEVDHSYQIARWGEDDEARQRRQGVRRDLATARRFLDLLADG